MSKYKTGKNPNSRNGFKKGFKHSEKSKIKMSKTHAGKSWGKHSEEIKRKIGEARKGKKLSKETKRKLSEINIGKKLSKETKRRISEAFKEKNNPNWQNGKSFEEYPIDWTDTFKESIRQRDNYICQECGIHQDELVRKLDVHHIDYDKKNLNPDNLITLCRKCHMKTNYDREKWIIKFKRI